MSGQRVVRSPGGPPEPSATGGVVAMAVAALATALGLLPVFLLGGLAVLMGPDLGFDERGLGLAVGAFFLVSAALSPSMGRLGDRLGPRRTLRLGISASVVSLVGIGTVARSWASLVALLAVGALGNAMSQMGGNVLLMRAVRQRRRALGFAVKQASVPFASLLGGAAVPVLGLTLGWRWAFTLSAVLALVLLVPLPTVGGMAARAAGQVARRPLLVVALGAASGAGAGNCAMTFLVPWATATGMAPGTAGALLAFGGAVGVTSRVLVGVACDRFRFDGLRGAATMMACASLGFAALAARPGGLAVVAVAVVVFGAGVGWGGLLSFAVAQSHPHAAGRATGVSQAGIFMGGIYAPPLFGLLVTTAGYDAAWLVTAGLALLGAALMLTGRALLTRAVGSTTASPST